jgi:hypothetical protein
MIVSVSALLDLVSWQKKSPCCGRTHLEVAALLAEEDFNCLTPTPARTTPIKVIGYSASTPHVRCPT